MKHSRTFNYKKKIKYIDEISSIQEKITIQDLRHKQFLIPEINWEINNDNSKEIDSYKKIKNQLENIENQ
jgi:hypothetical protein